MKSIASINTQVPGVEHYLDYFSGASLRDYDIVIFDPKLGYLERIQFDAGGSCLSIDSTRTLLRAMSHWSSEFQNALQAGKTVFVIMSDLVEDSGAIGSTLKGRSRNYSTSALNNYQAIPASVKLTNARGQKIVTVDSAFKGVYEALKETVGYRVIIDSTVTKKIYTTRDGSCVGAVVRLSGSPGNLVLLPYFDFNNEAFSERNDEGEEFWTDSALKISGALLGQVVEIDKLLRGSVERSPPPNWVNDVQVPNLVSSIDQNIAKLEKDIIELQQQRAGQLTARTGLLEFSHLLYENGKLLEGAIERTLKLLGYTAETLQINDLEIDHVIVGPSGKRMIGESEGKDSSAIDITKFRQLESNIGEDFEREEVKEQAKGILFGNGYRFKAPAERDEQFTQKSLSNAKRLGSALIRTADLYPIVVYLLDHPDDEAFKLACRSAIEETTGDIVKFPTVPHSGERECL